jgi:hypothetical protein
MITNRNIAEEAKTRYLQVNIEALTAGADKAATRLMPLPKCRITEVLIMADGDDSGITASNTSAWVIKNGNNTVASKTFNNTVKFPDAGKTTTLTLDDDYTTLDDGTILTYAITNGTSVATPATIMRIAYVPLDTDGRE